MIHHRTWGLDAGRDGVDWRDQGACRQFDPDLWTGTWPQVSEAVWICRNLCPVAETCARWANANRRLAANAVYGGIYWTAGRNSTDVRPCPTQPTPRRPWGVNTPIGPAPDEATAPTKEPRELSPCGTVAAAQRHHIRGERLCAACLAARRTYDRRRRREARARARGTA